MANFKFLRKIFPASPDKYLKYAPDAQASLARLAHLNGIINELNDCKFYEWDIKNQGATIPVDSSKGIIELVSFFNVAPTTGQFTNPTTIWISNPAIMDNVVDVDQVYIQTSVYYNPAPSQDEAVPYVIASGAGPMGRKFNIYQAGDAPPGNKNWTGLFYIYYEIKVIA
jgi:hypothetical protein